MAAKDNPARTIRLFGVEVGLYYNSGVRLSLGSERGPFSASWLIKDSGPEWDKEPVRLFVFLHSRIISTNLSYRDSLSSLSVPCVNSFANSFSSR